MLGVLRVIEFGSFLRVTGSSSRSASPNTACEVLSPSLIDAGLHGPACICFFSVCAS